jgi:formylglycine-generating enzyme required for sulfatase activity
MTTDRRLRELERRASQGDPLASWELGHERYRRGEGDAEGTGATHSYVDALDRALKVTGFTFLDSADYECGGQANRIAEFEHQASALVFCLIPRGSFLMGHPAEKGSRDRERPQHVVDVPPFLLAQTPCTQEAYERVMGENPSRYSGDGRLPVDGTIGDAFCQRSGLRLPSEAEWEYACRAGTTTRYCFGDDLPWLSPPIGSGPFWFNETPEGFGQLPEYAWLNTKSGTRPVGLKKPNAFGLFDVHGNVIEACQDSWHDTYEGAPSDGSAWEPKGGGVGRGGCWSSRKAWLCRCASRTQLGLTEATGFRPACSLPPPTS